MFDTDDCDTCPGPRAPLDFHRPPRLMAQTITQATIRHFISSDWPDEPHHVGAVPGLARWCETSSPPWPDQPDPDTGDIAG